MAITTTGGADLSGVGDRNRNATWAEAAPGSDPLKIYGGIASGLYASKTTGMGFQVGNGRGLVPSSTSADGALTFAVTSPETGTFATNDTTQFRIDSVIARAVPAGTSDAAVAIEILTGAYANTAAAAVPPTVPANATLLFDALHLPGTNDANGGWKLQNVDVSRVRYIKPRKQVVTLAPLTPTGSAWSTSGSIWYEYISPTMKMVSFQITITRTTGSYTLTQGNSFSNMGVGPVLPTAVRGDSGWVMGAGVSWWAGGALFSSTEFVARPGTGAIDFRTNSTMVIPTGGNITVNGTYLATDTP